MARLLQILLVCFFTLSGCKIKNTNTLTKLSVVLGGCNAGCPFLSVEIDSSLTYKYFCFQNCDSVGHFIGRVTRGFIDTLSHKLMEKTYGDVDTLFEYNRKSVYIEMIVQSQTTKNINKGS